MIKADIVCGCTAGLRAVELHIGGDRAVVEQRREIIGNARSDYVAGESQILCVDRGVAVFV